MIKKVIPRSRKSDCLLLGHLFSEYIFFPYFLFSLKSATFEVKEILPAKEGIY